MNLKQTALTAAVATALAAVPASVTAAAEQAPAARTAAVTSFDGRVLSVNREARTFRLRDLERGIVRIRVTRNTRFERIAGFRALRRGLLVETTARSSGRGWVASEVERPGRGGGGNDD